jgi:ADP-heptose:LPS heptosyltransferase
VGTAEDEVAAERLAAQCGEGVYSIAGKTTIIDLAAITKMCRLVIGVDTGVLHIASCFPTTIIAIFGPTRSIEYKPYSPNCIVIENTECVCDQFTHAKCDVMRGEYARCMYDLKPDRIIQVLSKVISASK